MQDMNSSFRTRVAELDRIFSDTAHGRHGWTPDDHARFVALMQQYTRPGLPQFSPVFCMSVCIFSVKYIYILCI